MQEHHAVGMPTKEHHIIGLPTYFAIYVILLVLLGATVGAYYVNLGFISLGLGILIAVVKAVLIIMYFMHVRFSSRLVWIFAIAGFIWLLILIGFTLSDYLTRGWLPFEAVPVPAP